jgi:hypothetical protein
MSHWPWWLGGTALASIAVAHWLILHRLLAVSGRYTAIVERLRAPRKAEPELSQDQMVDALRQATAAAFGDETVGERKESTPRNVITQTNTRHHVVFGLGLILGGVAVALLSGTFDPTFELAGEGFARLRDASSVPAPALLVIGGLLVGFGTRMSGGCTSGHGLCGVARFQPGSLVATAVFFAAGIGLSVLLEGLW